MTDQFAVSVRGRRRDLRASKPLEPGLGAPQAPVLPLHYGGRRHPTLFRMKIKLPMGLPGKNIFRIIAGKGDEH